MCLSTVVPASATPSKVSAPASVPAQAQASTWPKCVDKVPAFEIDCIGSSRSFEFVDGKSNSSNVIVEEVLVALGFDCQAVMSLLW